MARLVYLKRPKKRRNITRFTPPLPTSAVGTIGGAPSVVFGQMGIIGTAAGTSTVQGVNNIVVGTAAGTSQVSGVMGASNSVGTADATLGALFPIVDGAINAASANGSCIGQSSATGVPGLVGTAIGTSNATAFATVETQEIANLPDFESRVKSLIPPSWFEYSNGAPVLSIPVAGMAYGLLWIYILYLYTIEQSRIATATGVWLDRISYDFLGNGLPRLSGESDTSYSARIRAAIQAQKQTREGISDALEFLTGKAPKIIELWNPGDVGCYNLTSTGGATQGYGAAGMYGSLSFPNQILVHAFRPQGEGFPNIPGYGNVTWGYGATNGGEYCDLNNIVAQVKDSDIYANIAATVAAGITAWTVILTAPDVIDAPTAYFGNINNSADAAILGSGFFF